MKDEQVKNELVPIILRVRNLTIINEQTYKDAGNILLSIKALRKKVKEQFGTAVKKTYDAWKAAKAIESEFDDPLKKAEAKIKTSISDYTVQVNKEIAKETAKAEAEREAKAKVLVDAGKMEEAVATIEAPVVVAPVKVPEAPKTQGVSSREIWKAEVTNIKVLVSSVAHSESYDDLLLPNMPVLNQMARQYKSELSIPGVKAVSETVIAGRVETDAF